MTFQNARSRRLALESLCARRLLAFDLDPTFGQRGVLADPIAASQNPADLVRDVAVDGQGRILLVSSNSVIGAAVRNTISVSRLLPDGSGDPTFDGDGVARLALSSGREEALDIAWQADGKIIVLVDAKQYDSFATGRYQLVRLNSDGSIDTSFGDQGVAEGRIDRLGQYEAQQVIAGANGELYVIAARYDAAVITKFTSAGTIDRTYGVDGSVEISSSFPLVQDLVLLKDGSLLAGFSSRNGSENYQFNLVHIDATGTLDPQFGTSGRFTTSLTDDQRYSLYGRVRFAVDSQENIYVAGMRRTGTAQDFFVFKLDRSGTPDPEYGEAGQTQIVTGLEWGTLLQSLDVSGDGEVTFTGTIYFARESIVVRLDAAGAVDRSRAANGLNPLSSIDVNDRGLGGAVRLADGTFAAGFSTIDGQIVVLRFDGLGRLEPRFGGDGSIELDPVPLAGYSIGTAITELEGGKLLAASTDLSTRPASVYLTRYLADGSIDATYGEGGSLRMPANQYDGRLPSSFVSYGSEKFFAVNDGYTLRIARLTSAGEIDTSFGADGWITWKLPRGEVSVYQIDSLIAVADGFLLTAGGDTGILSSGYLIVKIDRDGKQVSSFGDNGQILIQQKLASGTDSRVQAWPDGSFVVLFSQASDRPYYETTLRRFHADGTLDASFGDAGSVKTSLSPWARNRQMVLRPDGRIVVLGNNVTGLTHKQFVVEQYLADGTLDPSFGTGNSGRVELPDVAASQFVHGLLIDSQGRLVVLGTSRAVDQLDTVLYRLDASGALDPSFDDDGIKEMSLSPYDEELEQMTETQSGKLLLSGWRLTDREAEPVYVRMREWTSPWLNTSLAEDVNGDSHVAPLDALLVINYLNQSQDQASLPESRTEDALFVDVNGDGLCTPIDALLVINKLNQEMAVGGEDSAPMPETVAATTTGALQLAPSELERKRWY